MYRPRNPLREFESAPVFCEPRRPPYTSNLSPLASPKPLQESKSSAGRRPRLSWFVLPHPRLAPLSPLSREQIGTDPTPEYQGTELETGRCPQSPGGTFIGNLRCALSAARPALPGYVTKSSLNHWNNPGKHETDVRTTRSPPGLLSWPDACRPLAVSTGGMTARCPGSLSGHRHRGTLRPGHTPPAQCEGNGPAYRVGVFVPSPVLWAEVVARGPVFDSHLGVVPNPTHPVTSEEGMAESEKIHVLKLVDAFCPRVPHGGEGPRGGWG